MSEFCRAPYALTDKDGVIVNERYNGGGSLPYFFRKGSFGPVIGKRTWGGLVGISRQASLTDGGNVTVPETGFWYPEEGKCVAENHGIDPNIEVNNTSD